MAEEELVVSRNPPVPWEKHAKVLIEFPFTASGNERLNNNAVVQRANSIFRCTSPPTSDILLTPANGSQASPTSDNGQGGPLCPAAALGTRKRPLLAGGSRTSMTPTKRTVMSLLARARAAQAKQLPVATAFSRAAAFDERTPTLVPLLREDYMSAVNLNLI
ncbi:hypothetical protein JTB14_022870 [Gonioctena quinquepunctata]|nr:hypothetical protein JTB14_022870 [Gonioctena quinquepunctata]